LRSRAIVGDRVLVSTTLLSALDVHTGAGRQALRPIARRSAALWSCGRRRSRWRIAPRSDHGHHATGTPRAARVHDAMAILSQAAEELGGTDDEMTGGWR
jgi:hypothetical protein